MSLVRLTGPNLGSGCFDTASPNLVFYFELPKPRVRHHQIDSSRIKFVMLQISYHDHKVHSSPQKIIHLS